MQRVDGIHHQRDLVGCSTLLVGLRGGGEALGRVAPESSLGARYRLSAATTVGVTRRYTWGVGGATILSVDSRVSAVDYSAASELPTAGGGNVARFGVSTTLALSDTTSPGLYGSVQHKMGIATNQAAHANLHYKTGRLRATLGTNVVYTRPR